MDNIKNTALEISKKTGVIIGDDDPIMILLSANEVLLNETKKSQGELLSDYATQINSITEEWANKSLTRAENICNASILAAKTAIDNQVEANTKKTIDALNEAIKNLNINESNTLKTLKILTYTNIIASILIVGVTILLIKIY